MQKPRSDGRLRHGNRFLDLKIQTLAVAIHIHRDARILAPSQEVLIYITVDLIVARKLGQTGITTVHALASTYLSLQLPLQLCDTRLECFDRALGLRLFTTASSGSERPEPFSCSRRARSALIPSVRSWICCLT